MPSLILMILLGLLLANLTDALAEAWPHLSRANFQRACPNCRHPLTARRLISLQSALLTWIRSSGRCPACGSRLSWRAPFIELALVSGLSLLWLANGWNPRLALEAFYLTAGVLIIAIDMDQLRIPNLIVYPMYLIAALAAVAGYGPRLAPGVTGTLRNALVGGGVALAIFLVFFVAGLLFAAVLRAGTGPGLGMGDVKLAGLVGLITGYPGVMQALTATVALGALAALMNIGWQIIQRRYKPGRALPYGPFLVFGAIYAAILPG